MCFVWISEQTAIISLYRIDCFLALRWCEFIARYELNL
jgi:hypothetical protein